MEKQHLNLVTLQIEQKHHLHGVDIALAPKKFSCSVDEIVVCKEDAIEQIMYKNIGSLTIAEKRFMCKQAFGNQTGYALAGSSGEMLADSDLVVMYEYLQWNYMNPAVHMVQSSVVKMALHFGLSEEAVEGNLCLQTLKEMMQRFEIVILPVHCESPLHWTFVHLEMEPESPKVVEVKYYDWLKGEPTCRTLAQKLLTLITLDPAVAGGNSLQLPQHCNHWKQEWKSNDCGFAGWQALENALKAKRLEDPVGVRPVPKAWRKTLKVLLEQLVTAQSFWKMESATSKKPKHPVCIPGVKKLGAAAEPLKLPEKGFFTCSACRWSQSGEGCCYCNPAKFAALREQKEKYSRQLAAALKKALDSCVAMNLIPAEPEAAGPESTAACAEPHSGGGHPPSTFPGAV